MVVEIEDDPCPDRQAAKRPGDEIRVLPASRPVRGRWGDRPDVLDGRRDLDLPDGSASTRIGPSRPGHWSSKSTQAASPATPGSRIDRQAAIDDDPPEPRREPSRIAEPGQVAPGTQEHLAGRLLGSLLIAEDRRDLPKGSLDPVSDDAVEGIPVALPGALHQEGGCTHLDRLRRRPTVHGRHIMTPTRSGG